MPAVLPLEQAVVPLGSSSFEPASQRSSSFFTKPTLPVPVGTARGTARGTGQGLRTLEIAVPLAALDPAFPHQRYRLVPLEVPLVVPLTRLEHSFRRYLRRYLHRCCFSSVFAREQRYYRLFQWYYHSLATFTQNNEYRRTYSGPKYGGY